MTPYVPAMHTLKSIGRFRQWKTARYYWSFLLLIPALILSKAGANYGSASIYLPPLLGLAVCAWFGGVGSALFFQICSAVATFSLIDHPNTWAQISPRQVYALGGYIIVGKVILFVTSYARWSRNLRRREHTLRLLAEATHDMIWEWKIRSDQLYLTGNLKDIFGDCGSPLRMTFAWWQEHIHPEDAPRVASELSQLLKSSDKTWDSEYRLRQADGAYAIVAFRGSVIRDKQGNAVRVIGGLSNVTVLRKAQEQLAFDAFHDDLTGLPNRRYFREQLNSVLAAREDTAGMGAVLFFDLDRFKTINDSLGHTVGDQLLQAVSQRLMSSVKENELVARFGADEFTVLVNNVATAEEATEIADRIQRCLASPFQLEGHSVIVSASIGIALARRSASPEEILRHADVAMYRAKSRGRARFEIFESDRDALRINLVQMGSEIRKAITNDELRLYYQPIVTLYNGELQGVEALVRWRHPQRGLILPDEFLPIVEESGLTIELDKWIFMTACRHLKQWREKTAAAEDLCLSVNVAQAQLFAPEFPSMILSYLERNGLQAKDLMLELTENIVFSNNEDAKARMLRCRNAGLRFALDDFGKGYSSLARVHELPISTLKIDGSFIQAISDGQSALADAAVALGRTLGLEVVAEFVETRGQAEHLRRVGCTAAQGTYFSAPLEPEHVLSFLFSRYPLTSTKTAGL